MKRRISPSRYTSMLYPDITSYRGALIDLGQVIAALSYGLRKGIVPNVSARQLGWGEWLPEETKLSDLIAQCHKADGVLGFAVDVTDRVTKGIQQAMDLSDSALVLSHDAVACGLADLSRERLAEASHWEQVASVLRLIAGRESPVRRWKVTRARATLRAAEREKRARSGARKGG